MYLRITFPFWHKAYQPYRDVSPQKVFVSMYIKVMSTRRPWLYGDTLWRWCKYWAGCVHAKWHFNQQKPTDQPFHLVKTPNYLCAIQNAKESSVWQHTAHIGFTPDKRSSDLLLLADISTSFSAALKKEMSPVTLLDLHVIQQHEGMIHLTYWYFNLVHNLIIYHYDLWRRLGKISNFSSL